MTRKILCLGNNTVDTDIKTTQLAEQNNEKSFGLLSEIDGKIIDFKLRPGYYHTSVYDIEYHRLLELAQNFNSIIILDQSCDDYSHPDAFYQTIRLANELSLTQSVTFLNPASADSVNFFEQLVTTNKSFCIFPFIELLTNNGSTTVCCRSFKKITTMEELEDFQTDPNYNKIRTKMIAGEMLPDHCSSCYQLEKQGIVSARIQETIEWANRLNLTSVDDLKNIQYPAYYEVRPSNICNLQCRTCVPQSSHLIAKEYTALNLIKNFSDPEFSNFDFINFTNLKKLYVAGGEPTAMIEFYEFLDRCIENHQTDFELVINTNGTKLSNRFKEQLSQFQSVTMIISIDGYKDYNHYIRWPSSWDSIIDNTQYIYKYFSTSFNVTVSIYNISNLYLLLSFLDQNFPKSIVHCQLATSYEDKLSALNFPYTKLVVDDLTKIQNLNCYKNDRLLKSFINGIIDYYSKRLTVNLNQLKSFFEFNDILDKSRNINLIDYIPELEKARPLI